MAKTSSIEKNNRRKKLSKQLGSKRAALKAVVMDQKLSLEDRFAASLKLAALPRNSASNRVRNRCEVSGRPRAYYRKPLRSIGPSARLLPQAQDEPYRPARTRQSRAGPGPGQVELVRREDR
jgi:small subunit ribosomal protein S14